MLAAYDFLHDIIKTLRLVFRAMVIIGRVGEQIIPLLEGLGEQENISE